MDHPAPACPTCAATMEEGYIPDLANSNTPSVPKWTEGQPERSFWWGLNLRNRERLAITTYRCPKCGLLQSYART